MARVRLYERGPSVGVPPHIPRITTSFIRQATRDGVILRDPPGTRLGTQLTNKSVLRKKVVKGLRQPGLFTPNYPSPMD